jgi:adenosylcobinamide-GDP ribazoletransferase
MSVTRPVAVAVQFLTRFPALVEDVTGEDLGRSIPFFPLAGALLGAALAALAAAISGRLAAALGAVLLVAAHAFLTGGLHLDGLADLFDGLSGGAGDRARTLAIMKDSRIGAHGATALVLALLLKTAALVTLLGRRDLFALLAFPAVARFAVVPLVVWLPYARPEGLGKPFHGGGRGWHVPVAAVFAATAAAGMGLHAVLPVAAALLAAGAAALAMHRRLGGLTGDVYGACIELAEVGFLLAAAAG